MTKLLERVLRLMNLTSTKLVLLALCIVMPIMALSLVNAMSERQRILDVAEQRLLELAKLAAQQQNDIVQEADNLLRVLARVPAVINATPERCHELLLNVASGHPHIVNVTVIDQAGDAICDGRDEKPTYNVADRSYYRELMSQEPLDFSLSELVIGKSSGKPIIIAAVPLAMLSANGLPKGIVAASISLDWTGRLAQYQSAADANTVLVFDARDGTVLASASGDVRIIGHKFPDHPLIRAFRAAPGGGVISAVDFSGTPRIFGFAALPGTNGHMVVAVGLTVDAVLEDANRHFVLSLGLALGVVGITLFLALMAARSWLLRPGANIMAAVEAFGMGDLGQRIATIGIKLSEMKQLSNAFNAMADAIQNRDRKLGATLSALEDAIAELDRLAHTDALTGLANRRHFDKFFDIEWRRAVRESEPIGLLMIDLDRFKIYNDTFGHPAGDACLSKVADAVCAALRRPADLAARYGGEEMVVILPNTDTTGTAFIGEQIAEAVRSLRIPHPANPGHFVTISVGAASCIPAQVDALAPYLLARADKALYEAKMAGRDQVRLAADDAELPAMQTALRKKHLRPVGCSRQE